MSFMNNAVLLEMLKKQSNSKRGQYQVILHDDAKNTVDHVVNCLMDICNQGELQAYQCAIIVHNSKRCVVYHDKYDECNSIAIELTKLGLTVSTSKFIKPDV